MFDGLFPEPHNTAVMGLLFTMAHWHGLAKLRVHHDLLLDSLDEATKALGLRLRKFVQRTCTAFDTKELHREYNARTRRQTKQAAHVNRQTGASAEQHPAGETSNTTTTTIFAEHRAEEILNATSRPPVPTSGRRHKMLNINTYKFHSYGDYARTIRTYGTMDSYSSEPVSVRP